MSECQGFCVCICKYLFAWVHEYMFVACVCVYVCAWVFRCLPPVWPKNPQPCIPSCRTATIWRSLSPFWGEEYTVHLPLDFHHLAFYVLDEDTVGCVCWGPKPGHLKGGGMPQSKYLPTHPALDTCPTTPVAGLGSLTWVFSAGMMTSLARSR